MAMQINDEFVEAVQAIRTILGRTAVPEDVFSGDFLDTEDVKRLDINATGIETSDNPSELSEDVPRVNDKPVKMLDTGPLKQLMQDEILNNASSKVGIRRGAMDAVARQSHFILDLQRNVGRKSLSRLERLVRAATRRRSLGGASGPLDRLQKHVEERIAASER